MDLGKVHVEQNQDLLPKIGTNLPSTWDNLLGSRSPSLKQAFRWLKPQKIFWQPPERPWNRIAACQESLGLQGDPTSPSWRGNQSWIFIGRTDAETPILWPPDAKSWLIWKDLDAGKDGRQEKKGMREDEMVGWHHWLNEHEFESTLGVGDGQGGLECYSPWGHRKSDMTERLN